MEFVPCRVCGFWLSPEEPHCPDCGRGPTPPPPKRDPRAAAEAYGAALGAALGGVVGALVAYGVGGEAAPLFPVIGASVTGAISGVIARISAVPDAAPPGPPAPHCMREQERRIQERLREIDAAVERLAQVRRRVEREAADPEWARVLAVVADAERSLPEQRDAYRLRLWDILFTRWLNRLGPAAARWNEIDYEECEERLGALETAIRNGRILIERLHQAGLPESAGGRTRVQRMEEALEACEEVRRGLVARQAESVVEQVRPLKGARVAASETPATGPLDLLRARLELGELDAGLEELEREHARLQSELEVTARLQAGG